MQPEFQIFEGEDELVKNNRRLGRFKLKNLPPRSKGLVKIDVTFSIDKNGVLRIEASDTETNATTNYQINLQGGFEIISKVYLYAIGETITLNP